MKLIKHHKYWRALEILPGALTWSALILPVVLSFYIPEYVALFAIIYTTYWLFRSIKLSFDLIHGYRRTKIAQSTDWNELLDYIEHPEHLDTATQNLATRRTVENRRLETVYRELTSEITHLKSIDQYKKPSEIYHAILFVTYKEPLELVRESIRSYTESTFSPKKMIFVFSGEESDKENAEKYAALMQKEFGAKFHEFIATIHPKNRPNEIPGKSANATWAAHNLQKYLDDHHIDYENVILSNFDADTVADKQYFSELTFRYIVEENRSTKTYQPTHFFHNNIWEVPMLIRMISLSSTFIRLAESMNPEKYKSFSSRSMGFQSAVDSDFWDPMVIPEDSRQYWTSYIKYHGNNELVQVYTPVYMDAVQSKTYVGTFKDQYKQLRRWAWGVTDFPFVALNLWYSKEIPRMKKFTSIFTLLQDHFYWATTAILLAFTGYLPNIFNTEFRTTVLSHNVPQLASTILNISAIGIIICAFLSYQVLTLGKHIGFWRRISLGIQWLFVPITSIFLTAIPAIEAQTRLLLNKRLDYQVTTKVR